MSAPRSGCLLVFLGVWFIGWTFGGISAIQGIMSVGDPLNPVSLFLLFWLVGWLAGEVAVGAIIAFFLDGREVLILDTEKLTRRAEAFNWGLSHRYEVAHVKNLRPVSSDGDGGIADATEDGPPREFLAFEYAGKTVRVGTNLRAEEAQQIADAMWRYDSRLAPAHA